MGIKASDTRVSLIIDRDFKKALQELAKQDRRSLNNLINIALQDYYKKNKKKLEK